MSYSHRCTDRRNCGTRKTLKKLIDQYVRKPKCPGCGKDTLNFDPSVKAQTKRRGKCYCGNVKFQPHRPDAYPECIMSKREITEADWERMYDHNGN